MRLVSVSLMLAIICFCFGTGICQNNIMVDIDEIDIAYTTYDIPIAWENDVLILAATNGYTLSVTGATTAEYVVGGLYVVPGSRADGALMWNSLYVGAGNDTVLVGGSYSPPTYPGVSPGSLEPMYCLPITIAGGEGEICVDSCYLVPPMGYWIWDAGSGNVNPTFNYSGNAHCIDYHITDPIQGVYPAQNLIHADIATAILATFTENMDEATIEASSFLVTSGLQGSIQGNILYNQGSRTAIFDPDSDFKHGDMVTVLLTTDIEFASGLPLPRSYSWSFLVEVDNGIANFDPPVEYEMESNQPRSMAAADFNNDDDPDLAMACFSGEVSVMLNNGNGTFAPRTDYAFSGDSRAIVAGDFDLDGNLDLAFANRTNDFVGILYGDGTGDFPTSHPQINVGDQPSAICAADFDGDADLDLAVLNALSENIMFLQNDGNGLFGLIVPTLAVGHAPQALAVGDVDGNGSPDLICTNYDSDNVSVILNGGYPVFDVYAEYDVGDQPQGVIVYDFNYDSHLDLATANKGSDDMSVLLNNGDGTFGTQTTVIVGDEPQSIAAGDFNDDSYIDIVIPFMLTSTDGVLAILINDGLGSFNFKSMAPVGIFYGTQYPVLPVDVDGDGDLDIVSTFYESAPVNEWFLAVLMNREPYGDLDFRPDVDGWSFSNTEINMWPQNWWNQFDYTQPPYPPLGAIRDWSICQSEWFPDWPLFVDAFGENNCYFSPSMIIRTDAEDRWFAIIDPVLPGGIPDDHRDGDWGGSCYGLSVTSLLFFDEIYEVNDTFPPHYYLNPVPLSDESREMINRYSLYQFGQVQLEDMVSHLPLGSDPKSPKQTLLDIWDMFSNPVRDDRVLIIFDTRPDHNGGHAIVPFRCEPHPIDPHTWRVYVYEVNQHSNNTLRIEIDTLNDSWYYSAQPNWGGDHGILLTEPMSIYTTNPTKTYSTDYSLTSGYCEYYISNGDTIVFESGAGIIGEYQDSVFSTVSDAMPIIPITGEEEKPLGYYLPDEEWLCQFTGIDDSLFRLYMFGDSVNMVYTSTGIVAGQHEELRHNHSQNRIMVYNPDLFGHTHELRGVSNFPDSDIVITVSEINLPANDSIGYTIISEAKTLESIMQIDNYGGAKTYNLFLRQASANGLYRFSNDGITIYGDCSHRIVPDWREYGDSLMILIDWEMGGTYSDSMMVANEFEPPYICGDANSDDVVNVSDAVYIINYVFVGGDPPDPIESGDCNCDDICNVSDAVWIINYVFVGGNDPCDTDGDNIPDC